MERPRVVIVGAGFGGLWAAKALAKEAPGADVLLLDRNNYHTFFPMLYQVAAAELVPSDIAYPVRSILRKVKNARFRKAEVRRVDLAARTVESANETIPYDRLVLALGSESNDFGVEGAEQNAFFLRWMDDAVPLRQHVLACLEAAVDERDPVRRRRLLTFVIVGGGPTGVEYAGALSELLSGPAIRDYKGLVPGEVRVVLVEASDRVLLAFPPRLSRWAAGRLARRGVNVRFGAAVEAIADAHVRLKGGETIESETVVWTAGIKGDPRVAEWGLPVGRGGRVPVKDTLQLDSHPEVYVVGDLALAMENGKPLAQLCQVAMQGGAHAAKNIGRSFRDEPQLPFHYNDLGTLAVIGRNAAVADLGGRKTFTGFPAWMLWLGIHIFWLIGFRNRILVLINWAWNYLFPKRSVRLIVPSGVGDDVDP
jgi:NADH dehydrogenase